MEMETKRESLYNEIRAAISEEGRKRGSTTSELILAQYLMDCAAAFGEAIEAKFKHWNTEHPVGEAPSPDDLEPCPNPKCKMASSDSTYITRCPDDSWRVHCQHCGMWGPIAETANGAVREWNQLPWLKSRG